jgi:hypothetical protein
LLQWGAKVKGGHQHSHLVFQTNRQVRRVQNRHISIIVSIQIKNNNNNNNNKKKKKISPIKIYNPPPLSLFSPLNFQFLLFFLSLSS